MPKTKDQKEKILKEIEQKILNQKFFFLFDFTGLKAQSLNELRKKVLKFGGEIKVVKKTLAQILFEKEGFDFDFFNFKGQLAILFCFKNDILPLKLLKESSQNENFKILGGFSNKEFLKANVLDQISQFSSNEEVFKKLIFIMKYPILKLPFILKNNFEKIVFILAKVKDKI